LLPTAFGHTYDNDAGVHISRHQFLDDEVKGMKAIILMTMILAIMAPVIGQTSKFKVYECLICKAQRQSQFRPPSSAGKGGCVGSGGQRFDFHNWQELR